jgi:hypothetical protein
VKSLIATIAITAITASTIGAPVYSTLHPHPTPIPSVDPCQFCLDQAWDYFIQRVNAAIERYNNGEITFEYLITLLDFYEADYLDEANDCPCGNQLSTI